MGLGAVPIFQPTEGSPMRVAGFMSGSGTNLVRILEYQQRLVRTTGSSPYQVTLIFTDRRDSNAEDIAKDYDLPVVVNDIMDFYRSRGHANKLDLSLRPAFDEKTVELLADRPIDMIALAGYMSIVTEPLLRAYAGRMVNVHPADLRVTRGGERVYTGARAIELAILAGEKSLYSTTHLVREEVDAGEILLVSDPVRVELPHPYELAELREPEHRTALRRIADGHQERVKTQADWVIYPKTLELLGSGRFALADGVVHFDGRPCPMGVEMTAIRAGESASATPATG